MRFRAGLGRAPGFRPVLTPMIDAVFLLLIFFMLTLKVLCLRYEHVGDALTAVTGQVADDGRTVVRLVDSVRLLPPRGGE